MQHPRYFRRLAMLEMLGRLQDRIEEEGESQLDLEFYREPERADLQFSDEHRPGGRRIHLGSALGMTGASHLDVAGPG